ncbi:hypothetical protein B7L88_gp157 [Rhizobium phage RHEph10]|uniref:hypothetical protein n=1 Tax=Rhizobium phage RHEph10 TaxID=1220717 RepID=UPI0002AAF983|nr:hypothetical protein B7L88_gp157 [Rhizobium phage RHEph10]AGC36131.1 hypothetical protein RHEph10_gp088 [Rhizobium phage RHEph10]
MSGVTPEAAEWPTHVEELSRKLNEQLKRRVDAHTRGVINDKELYLLVSFAWDLTAGLVFESDSRTLETLHTALRATLKGQKK